MLGAVEELVELVHVADVVREVVFHQDTRAHRIVQLIIVPAEVVAAVAAGEDVIAPRDIGDAAPHGRTALRARRDQHCETVLAIGPVVLQDVALHQHALGVLQFEDVLHAPRCACIVGMSFLPTERLEEVVVPHFDVRGYEVLDVRVGPAEHHVLTCAFEVVVHDLEGPRSVPSADGLRVLSFAFAIADVAIDHRRARTVECDAAFGAQRRVPVDVEPIEDDVMRQIGQGVLSTIARADQIEGISRTGDLQPHEVVMMRPTGEG